MCKPFYGDPVVTLRLPREMIAAAKISAKRHETTFSGLVRSLIEQVLQEDGIDWFQPSETIPGQMTFNDDAEA